MLGFRNKKSDLLGSTSHTTPVGTMRSTWGLYASYWKSGDKAKAYGMAGVIAALTLTDVFLNVQVAFWWKEMYDAIAAKDLMEIGKETATLAGLFCAKAGVISTRNYLSMGLHLMWRGWLQRQFTEGWMKNNAFFHLNNVPGLLDNPDARIAEDINSMTGHLVGLSMGGLQATTTLISFTALMLSISGTVPTEVMGQMWNLPSMSFWFGFGAAAACAGIGTFLTHKIGSPLFFLNDRQRKVEADMRAALLNIRSNAAEIASYDSQKVEHFKLRESFHKIRLNWHEMRKTRSKLMAFNIIYADTANMAAIAIGGASYAMSKTMTIGQVMQFAETFNQLRGSMSWFINVYPALFDLIAVKNRLTGFAQKIEEAQDARAFYRASGRKADITVERHAGNSIIIENLSLNNPSTQNVMLRVPELEIKKGERLLITGESGSGKSSLLRAIRGLWQYGDGNIKLPEGHTSLFAPQVTHVLDNATLRENICYPQLPDAFTDEQIESALRRAEMTDFVPHIDHYDRGGTSWRVSLSIGEKQRLVFARLFLHKPDIVFLDEATAALDDNLQRRMYSRLIESLPQATIISVAHRSSVALYHSRRVSIENGALVESTNPASDNDNIPPARIPPPGPNPTPL